MGHLLARTDAIAIWNAGVQAVLGERLVRQTVCATETELCIGPHRFDMSGLRHIAVVGAGKASGGMVVGLEESLCDVFESNRLSGWVNVPSDCVRPTKNIRLHSARPPGINEPTKEAEAGAKEILSTVRALGPDDLCICLLSGGGSALLPAPANGVTLRDKVAITRFLSGAGANISELNSVRAALSEIKGGGLARACKAGRLVTLVLSDVIGDPLETIASGPTVEREASCNQALAVLESFGCDPAVAPTAFRYLQNHVASDASRANASCETIHLVIGNNQHALRAAADAARRRGYEPLVVDPVPNEGTAEDVACEVVRRARSLRPGQCLISGGEPVVRLVSPDRRGMGGRNQQLVLSALERLQRQEIAQGLVILSAGTDGEDGPTDAAGASGRSRSRLVHGDPVSSTSRIPGRERCLCVLRKDGRTHQDRTNAYERLRHPYRVETLVRAA